MTKFYISLRPIRLDEKLYYPHAHLDKGFAGLDIKHNLIAFNSDIDGRMLYEIKIGEDSDYSELQIANYKSAFIEGCALFSCHEKTLESAAALAEAITDCDWNIVDDSIVNSHVGEA